MHQDLRALGRLQQNDFNNRPLNQRRHEIMAGLMEIMGLSTEPEFDKTNPTGSDPQPPTPSPTVPLTSEAAG
jgi:hypothetical protein